MTLGDKLSKLRKEKNYTQEQLADILGVSRQSVSKWESDNAYPETDKLIRISELFGCSLDYLLKETNETESSDEPNVSIRKILREKKSEKICFGMPLWHIGKNAKGVVAVGMNATGIIVIGLKAKGIISIGLLSIGILSFGMLPIGLIALGWLAIGILAAGAISFGIISLGAIAIGDFSAGALAIGKYFAIGDNANAMIALGDSHASGSVFQNLGELSAQSINEVKNQLDAIVPGYLSWVSELIKLFL